MKQLFLKYCSVTQVDLAQILFFVFVSYQPGLITKEIPGDVFLTPLLTPLQHHSSKHEVYMLNVLDRNGM